MCIRDRDSPYASSIAQRWYSGLYELAYTRYREPAFGRVLKVMYGQEPADSEFKNAEMCIRDSRMPGRLPAPGTARQG